jgi:hypothetical protein
LELDKTINVELHSTYCLEKTDEGVDAMEFHDHEERSKK